MAFAHTANGAGRRHDLVDHLEAVAALAAEFAQHIGAERLAHLAGLWHDIGKFAPGFQDYPMSCEREPDTHRRGPDHKAAGALLASRNVGLPALLVQGHHGGLREPTDLKAWLAEKETDPAVRQALELAQEAISNLVPAGQPRLPDHVRRDRRAAEMFLRLVFSALVDADYFDTERHFRAHLTAEWGGGVTMADLWDRLSRDQTQFSDPGDDPLARARGDVYEACVAAAEHPRKDRMSRGALFVAMVKRACADLGIPLHSAFEPMPTAGRH